MTAYLLPVVSWFLLDYVVVSKRSHTQSGDRPMLSQEIIDGFRRERILKDLAEAVSEVGPHRVTVADVTSRGRIARSTFYGQFENIEDALGQAVEFGSARLRGAIDAGADCEGTWDRRTGEVVSALLAAASAEPALAELCLVHACARPDVAGPLEPAVVEALAGVLRARRRSVPGPGPGLRTEELIAYGILAVIAERLRHGGAATLPDLSEELTALAVLPFPDQV